jgi:hypothetical protein
MILAQVEKTMDGECFNKKMICLNFPKGTALVDKELIKQVAHPPLMIGNCIKKKNILDSNLVPLWAWNF